MDWAPDDDEKGVAPPPDALGLVVFDTETGRLDRARRHRTPAARTCGIAAGGVGLVRTVPDDPELATRLLHQRLPRAAGGRRPRRPGERTLLTETPWDSVALSGDGRYAAFTVDSEDAALATSSTCAPGERVMSLPVSDALGQRDSYVRALSADGSLLLYGDRPPEGLRRAIGRGSGGARPGCRRALRRLVRSDRHDRLPVRPRRQPERLGCRHAAPSSSGRRLPVAARRSPTRPAGSWSTTAPARPSGSSTARTRGEAGAVDTCRGFTPAGQLEVSARRARLLPPSCARRPDDAVHGRRAEPLGPRHDGGRGRPGHRPLPGWPARRLRVDHRRHRCSRSGPSTPRPASRRSPSRACVEWRIDASVADTSRRAGIGCQEFPDAAVPALPAADGVLARRATSSRRWSSGPAVWDAATGRLLTAQALPGRLRSASVTAAASGRSSRPTAPSCSSRQRDCQLIALSTDDWTVTRRVPLDESIGDCGEHRPRRLRVGRDAHRHERVRGTRVAAWLHRIDPDIAGGA